MRRRDHDGLVENELKILVAVLRLAEEGAQRFYGFELAKQLASLEETRRLMSHSTLYRGLRRLEERGWVESWWESHEEAAAAGREGRLRRYYRLAMSPARLKDLLQVEAERGPQRTWWTQWGLGALRG